MTIADLDSAEREVEQLDRRTPRAVEQRQHGLRSLDGRDLFRCDGDMPHMPRDQHRRVPERAEGDDDV
jgi:hypothetical protein